MPNPTVVIEIISTGQDRVRREIEALRREAGPAGQAQRQAAAATAAAGRQAGQSAALFSRAERNLNTLRSTLGGSERAAAQYETAQRRLNSAVAAGLVSQQEAARLQGLMATQFSTASVNARDLRQNMAGVRGEARQLIQLMSGQFAASAIPGIGGFAAGQAVPRLFGAAAGLGVIGGVGGAATFAATARAGSQLREFRAQIEATLGPGEEFNEIFDRLIEVSDETGTAIQQNVTLFRRLSQAREDLNATTQQMIQFEETLLQLIIASGVDSIEAAQGTRQLAQALASGRVQGDEFRTILEAMPAVARAAARGLHQMGVLAEPTIGALNRLRSEGRLSAEDFFNAIIRQSDEAETAFEDMPDTIGRAGARLRTAFFRVAASLGETTGATGAAVAALNTLAGGFRLVASEAEQAARANASFTAERRRMEEVLGAEAGVAGVGADLPIPPLSRFGTTRRMQRAVGEQPQFFGGEPRNVRFLPRPTPSAPRDLAERLGLIPSEQEIDRALRFAQDEAEEIQIRARARSERISRGEAIARAGIILPPESAASARGRRAPVPEMRPILPTEDEIAAATGRLSAVAREVREIDEAGMAMGQTLQDAFIQIATLQTDPLKGLINLIQQLNAELLRVATNDFFQQAGTQAGGFLRQLFGAPTGAVTGTISNPRNIPVTTVATPGGAAIGFQHGGSFTVGGTGGTDSQFVGFRATPGERVDVTPAGEGRTGGGVTFNIDARGADPTVLPRMQQMLDQALAQYDAFQLDQTGRDPRRRSVMNLRQGARR